MKRLVSLVTALAACLAVATPASAQFDPDNRWYVNAGIGPAFGTFGPTPALDARIGLTLTDLFSVQLEAGALPHADFEKADGIAPPVVLPPTIVLPPSDLHVNGFNLNGNLVARRTFGRLMPYATVGAGTFTGMTRQNLTSLASHFDYGNETHFASNAGVGLTLLVAPWAGLNVDYRAFVVNAADTETINRVSTGVVLFAR